MDKEQVSIDWGGTRGAVWTGAGALIGLLAQRSGLLGGNGILGGGTSCEVATQRDLDYERQLTKANAETAALQAKLDCKDAILASERRYEDKFDAIEKQINDLSATQAVVNANTMSAIGIIAEQAKKLSSMTTTIISAPSILASEAVAKSLPAPAAATSGSGS